MLKKKGESKVKSSKISVEVEIIDYFCTTLGEYILALL